MKSASLFALAAIATVATMTGCASSKITGGGQYAGIPQPKPEEYKLIYEHKPELVTGKSHVVKVLGFTFGDKSPTLLNQRGDPGVLRFFGESGEIMAQNAALYNACEKANADVVLAARYKIEKTGFFIGGIYDCEIKGFPANLKGIEKIVDDGKACPCSK